VQRHQSLQSYVPPLIADWIRDQARLRQVSVSIVVRDLLVAAWTRDNDALLRPTGPIRSGRGCSRPSRWTRCLPTIPMRR
jgi:hypothetical protein